MGGVSSAVNGELSAGSATCRRCRVARTRVCQMQPDQNGVAHRCLQTSRRIVRTMIALRHLLLLPLLALCLTLRGADLDIITPAGVSQQGPGFAHTMVATGLNVPQTTNWTIVSGSDGIATLPLIITNVGFGSATGVTNVSVNGAVGPALAIGQQRGFSVSFTPTALSFSFTVTITSNCEFDPQFTFTITGTVDPAPNIVVTRNLVTILDGGGDNLGTVPHSFIQRLTYTIRNTGTNPLILGTPTAGAGTGCTFTIVSTTPAINGGSTGTLVIDLTPTAGSASFSAPISFSTNDTDSNPFNFLILGVIIAPEPEITITRAGSNINTGIPNQITGAAKGETLMLTYTISNTGFTTLNFTTPAFANLVNCAVVITVPPVLTLAAPANSSVPPLSTTFQVALTPIDKGNYSFDVVLPATINDTDESTFTISNFGRALNSARPAGDEPPCGLGSGVGVLMLAAFGFVLVGGRSRR